MDFATARLLLAEVGMAEAALRRLDLAQIGRDGGLSEDAVGIALATLGSWGLILEVDDEEMPPLLLDAGRQYLALEGKIDEGALRFLPMTIDDLHARHAILIGGTILVDEFRAAALSGALVEHARAIVPAAFEQAIDERRALDLFAAAVALMARLSAEQPAGCVAEEVLAVVLMMEAGSVLEEWVETGRLDVETAETASGELRGLFELFQDEDTLRLFDMAEPADAAVAAHHTVDRQLGVVDQRIESWFRPFGGVARTGYLEYWPDEAAP